MTIYFTIDSKEEKMIMLGSLIIALIFMMIVYVFYRRYFFHKTRSRGVKKPYFTLKIEHE